MIVDHLSDAVWQEHAGGTADIGGVAYESSSLLQIPGGDLLLQVSGNAEPGPDNYPCHMWYTPRPIYSKTGCTLAYDLWVGATAPAAMNAMEIDCMYAMTCADGKMRLFNGSAQWLPGTGWMIVNAAGEWMGTGYNPGYLPDKKYGVEIVHAWDLTKNTFSVVSIDGFPAPADLQNAPAAVTTWTPGFVNVQLQPSGQPAGLAWAARIGKLRLEWEA
jgi:hypothetical protein